MKHLSIPKGLGLGSAALGVCMILTLGGCSVAIQNRDATFTLSLRKSNTSCFPFKEVEEVQLNTPDEIVLNGISHVQTTPSLIFIQDYNNNLYSFDRNGEYIRQFSHKGEGPEEYINFAAFTVTPDEEVMIYDDYRKQFLIYGFDGNFKRVLKIDMNSQSAVHQLEYLDSDRLAMSKMIFKSDNDVYGIINLSDKKVEKFAFVPLKTTTSEEFIGMHSLDVYKDTITYLKPFDPIIYTYPDTECYEIPTDKKVLDEENLKEIENFSIATYVEEDKKDAFWGYTDIFQLDDYIFLGYHDLYYAIINKNDRSIEGYEYRRDDEGRYVGVNRIIGKDGTKRLIGIKNNAVEDVESLFFYRLD